MSFSEQMVRWFEAAQQKISFRQRQLLRLLQVGGTFGVMSAYTNGPKSLNKARHGELVADLQRAGYARIIPLKGSWEGVTERSLLIPGIAPGVLFELGRKYTQDSVIYKSAGGVIGLYYLKGTPRAEVAVDPKGDPVFELASDSSLFSKARNLSFSLGFLWGQPLPWDGRAPITRKRLRAFVQHEMTQASP